MKLLWRRAGRLITEAMRGQTARLNATVAAEADFGNTDSQSCTALAGCERRRIFGFCSAADQSARHRPFFRFFSRAAATSGMLPPKGLRKQPLGFSFLRHRTAFGTCPCRKGRSPHSYCRHSITGVLYGILTGQIKKWPQQMLPALRQRRHEKHCGCTDSVQNWARGKRCIRIWTPFYTALPGARTAW